jgi:hypothetical protein
MLSQSNELALQILSEAAAIQAREAELQARLDDPIAFHRDLMHLSLENRHNGAAWLDLDPRSGYVTMQHFIEEPFRGRGKMILASRGCGKTHSIALPYVAKRILLNHSLKVLLGGERAVEVVKRSLWLRTRMEELDEDYGPLIDVDRWSVNQWTIRRPGGRGLQDTVTVGSPDIPGTSQHWGLGVFDDPVGKWTAESAARGKRGIEWFKEVYNQALEGSEIIIFDTLWAGENILTWIIKKLEGGIRLEPYERGYLHRGRHFDILVIRDRDEEGNPIFPCQPDNYLAMKEEVIGPEMYRSQYGNFMLELGDLTFDSAPLIEGEDPPDDNMRIYIMTDTATSTGRTKHTSISALFAVGKTPNGHAWMLGGAAGKLGWDRVPEAVIDLVERWKPERIIYEDTGPAKTLPKTVQETANAMGKNGKRIRRLFFPIPRTADKHARIQAIRPHVMAGKLHFAKTFPTSIFRVDKRGMFRGTLGEEFSNYTFGSDGSYDCLDAIADVWGYYGSGIEIFRPPKGKKKPIKPPKNTEGAWAYIQNFYDKRARRSDGSAD